MNWTPLAELPFWVTPDPLPPDTREAMVEAVAAALVAAYRERHPQGNVLPGKHGHGRIGP